MNVHGDHTHGGGQEHHAGDHHHGSNHDSHRHCGHLHVPSDFGRAFAIGTALNIGFVIVEAAYGYWANSMALLADAGHNLSDVAGLLMAWGASALGKRPASANYTYGLGAGTILAALANAVLLLVAVVAIIWEALGRFARPENVDAWTVIWVAAAGIVINAATAWLFFSGRHHDMNVRGAYLHMAADAGVSLGVVVAGIAILLTGLTWLDPLISIAIALIIVWGTWGLLKDSLHLAIGGVPPAIDAAAVRRALEVLPGVSNVHDLHIWPTSTTAVALTAHLVLSDGHPGDAFLISAACVLKERFGIAHATLQIEHGDAGLCDLRCDGGHGHD